MTDWLPNIKRQILGVMFASQERLDQFQIAATLNEAPFRVRAELQDLRRGRLVRSILLPRRIAWELTGKGERVAAGDQLELGTSR